MYCTLAAVNFGAVVSLEYFYILSVVSLLATVVSVLRDQNSRAEIQVNVILQRQVHS